MSIDSRGKASVRAEASPPIPEDVLTAGRLIALLEDYDAEAPIVIEGQYGGFEWVRAAGRMPLRLNVNSLEGFGPHERADPDEATEATVVAILVRPGPGAFEE
jgi:hypothetical protein